MALMTSLKWSFLSELASKAIQPIAFILLARILVPEDFGIVAAAMMVITFAQILWEGGVSKAIIQIEDRVYEAATQGFWINLCLGVFVATALVNFAPDLASLVIKDERASDVIKVMAVQVMLGALSSMQVALLQRDFEFKKLFWIRFGTVSLPGLTSIPLALLGYGYWSLVIGTLAGQLFQTTLLWIVSPWRPTLLIEVDIAKDIMRFGFWVTLSALLMWFFVWADIFVVGYFLGTHELGIYRTGNHFVIMTYALVFSPVLPVLYSYLSRAQYRPDLIRRCAFIAVSWISIISMPIAAFLFGFSDQLSQIIFGSVWNGIALVIGIMGVVHGFSWLAGMNGEFYRAIGRPELEAVINSIILVIYLLVYWFTIHYGLINFLYGRVALAVFSVVLHMILLDRILGLGLKIVFARLLPILVISLFMLILALLILRYFTDSVLWSLLFGVGNLLFTLGLVLLLYKKNIVTEYRDLKLLT